MRHSNDFIKNRGAAATSAILRFSSASQEHVLLSVEMAEYARCLPLLIELGDKDICCAKFKSWAERIRYFIYQFDDDALAHEAQAALDALVLLEAAYQ